MKVRVSVCIAAYNGEEYIFEQVRSVLDQMGDRDELIIVDDASTDSTRDKVESIKDDRVFLINNKKNIGHVRTFEKAISRAQGEFVFLADQDDIWVEGRLLDMLETLMSSPAPTVATNFYIFSGSVFKAKENKRKLPEFYNFHSALFGIIKGDIPYYGCCMAFRSEIKDALIPFPRFVESHDIWLAINSLFNGGITHLKKESLYHRIHDNNATPKRRRSLFKVLRTRLYFFVMILTSISRRFFTGRYFHARKKN
ncbi:glycosyltransferase [Halomonas sp. H5]|uniref:glycosyltransferase n=1 Tax=Halomonas sp. H5 TaxID=3423910 RepID=UPI003D36DAF0